VRDLLRRTALLVALLAAAHACLAATGAATPRLVPFPSQLVGVWSRTITSADIKHAGAKHAVPPGVWKMDINTAKNPDVGNVYITQNGRNVGLGGSIIALAPGQISITIGFPSGTPPGPLNKWRWKRIGAHITFSRGNDPNNDRIAFFAGTWTKTG
jgi:hypothetical protein